MKKTKWMVLSATTIWLLMLAGAAMAASDQTSHQVTMTIDEIAKIAIDGGNITLDITAPGAGESPADATTTSNYLRYTSTVSSTSKRSINVKFGALDTVPAGCTLLVTAGNLTGDNRGVSAGEKQISSTAEDIITDVLSCATGTGANRASLTYKLRVDAPGSLVAGDSKIVTVTYTLTDMAP